MLLALTSVEIQYFLIGALFVAAAFYVGRIFWRAFFSKTAAGCAKGCGGACGSWTSTSCSAPLRRAPPTARAPLAPFRFLSAWHNPPPPRLRIAGAGASCFCAAPLRIFPYPNTPTAMQDKEEERSLVNVENKLNKDGYTQDFNVMRWPPANHRQRLEQELRAR